MTPTPAEIDALDLARLPTLFREIAGPIGLSAAVKLAFAYQRQPLYVPKEFADGHQVVKLIGRRAADALSFAWSGTMFENVPGAARIIPQVRAMRMQEARTAGQSVRDIALEYGVSLATVKSLTRAA